MRRCRYSLCRKPFQPEKHFHFYCSWECRVADVGAHYEKRAYDRQVRDHSYDQGYWAGARAQSSADPILPPHLWKAFAVLVHPDRWGDVPEGIKALSHKRMVWLNAHKPEGAERN
jgi:hypothetical protein